MPKDDKSKLLPRRSLAQNILSFLVSLKGVCEHESYLFLLPHCTRYLYALSGREHFFLGYRYLFFPGRTSCRRIYSSSFVGQTEGWNRNGERERRYSPRCQRGNPCRGSAAKRSKRKSLFPDLIRKRCSAMLMSRSSLSACSPWCRRIRRHRFIFDVRWTKVERFRSGHTDLSVGSAQW